jgi:hypothetical protein
MKTVKQLILDSIWRAGNLEAAYKDDKETGEYKDAKKIGENLELALKRLG